MIDWLSNDILAFAIALVLAGIIIPQILLIAFRKKLFDDIDERKIHKGVVPRLGGIAFLPSILFSVAVIIGFNLKYGNPALWTEVALSTVPMYFYGVCGVADVLGRHGRRSYRGAVYGKIHSPDNICVAYCRIRHVY